jgi:ADP-ribosylglycohydrolase
MASLRDKIFGCLAASRIGSSMGAATEGWSPERIDETYGKVDRLYGYKHYVQRGIDWQRMPGTTEDGIERQKLQCKAIIEKGDRITAEDLYRVIAASCDLESMRFMTQPEDMQVAGWIKAGVPPTVVGSMTTWQGCNFNRGCQAIGLINAGDPDGAVRDVHDIGRLYFPAFDPSLEWAGVYVAAIAEALRPDATVESALAAGLEYARPEYCREIGRALEIAERFDDFRAFRAAFYEHYNGIGVPYAFAKSNETVSKAFAVVAFRKGDPRKALLDGVNFGRDTDCLAASAGGLAGALSGSANLPTEWIEQVDRATAHTPYTAVPCTIAEHADGIHAALRRRAGRMRALCALIEDRQPAAA